MRKNSYLDSDVHPQIWDDIFRDCRKAVARVIARIVRPNDIEDVVQETYLRIFQASKRRTIHHPRAFMLKAARNIAFNHVMRADALNHLETTHVVDDEDEYEEEVAFEEATGAESPEVCSQAEQEFLVFCQAVRELPAQCRRAFILKKVYGLSQKEVAKKLNISQGTVEKHIAKGIVMCSVYMTSHGHTRNNTKQRRPTRAGN